MKNLTPEQIITRTGVVALAILAAIGFFAVFLAICGADYEVFYDTIFADLYWFTLIVLFILVGFCVPTSLLINCSSIAASLKNNTKIS